MRFIYNIHSIWLVESENILGSGASLPCSIFRTDKFKMKETSKQKVTYHISFTTKAPKTVYFSSKLYSYFITVDVRQCLLAC